MIAWTTVALIVAAAVLVTTLLCYLVQTRQIKRKINYMLDALEDGESNFRFASTKRTSTRALKSAPPETVSTLW